MTINFSAFHLLIGDESPSAEILKPILSDGEDNFSSGETHYLITTSNVNDEYFWLYARYGTSLPYSATVYNTESQKEESNPRTTKQVETDKQIFGLYSISQRTLYLSNIKKKYLIEEYLKSKTLKDVSVKSFFKNVDEFIEQIKSVEKVKFVAKSNLFNAGGEIMKIFPNPQDLYGLGVPDDFTLEANFSNARVTNTFGTFLKKLVGWKNSCEADSLLCVGRDDKNFEAVFNAESFIQKVTVQAGKDNQGMHAPEIVKNALISRIESKDNEKSS